MSEGHWQYRTGAHATGSVHRDRLAELHAAGLIADATLVRVGVTGDWQPYSVAAELDVSPPLPESPAWGRRDRYGWTSRPIAPWRRLWARTLDTIVNGNIVEMAVAMVGFVISPERMKQLVVFLNTPLGLVIGSVALSMMAIPLNTAVYRNDRILPRQSDIRGADR
jgi:hypothetical protein